MSEFAGRPEENANAARVTGRRSLAKAVTYRLIVMCADAAAIYLLTGQWRVAAGFMVVSNIYTTVLYFLHERAWARIRWGRAEAPPSPSGPDPQPRTRRASAHGG